MFKNDFKMKQTPVILQDISENYNETQLNKKRHRLIYFEINNIVVIRKGIMLELRLV